MTSVFEEKNISRAIMRVGLPAMLGQLTTLIYNIADTFFISLTKEPATIAAVTLCAPILLIIMSIACIFGMGGSSVIARLLGEEKNEESGTTMNFCVYAMAIAGVMTLILGLAFLRPLAKISGADADNIAYTCDYLKWIFAGAPFIMLANGFVHLFRSVGLIKESTIGLILGNVINMLLDYFFIAILGWGTKGAALATSLGFVCATIYYIACMIREEYKGNQCVPLALKRFSPNVVIIRNVVSIGTYHTAPYISQYQTYVFSDFLHSKNPPRAQPPAIIQRTAKLESCPIYMQFHKKLLRQIHKCQDSC